MLGDAARRAAAEDAGIDMADELAELELAEFEDSEREPAPPRIGLPPRFGRRSESWDQRSSRLHEELRSPARAMIRRAFRSAFCDDEIDDIYSSAWLGTLRALRSREADMGEDEIRRYVMAAVANHAVKELRRRKRKPIAPLDAAGQPADPSATPAEAAASSERSQMARDLLSSLPPRRRAVMLLRYGWGLEPKQVCGLVKGLSPRAYRKEINRGVEQFAERLKKLDEGAWCEEREPVLQSFVAGTADAEEKLQAKAHLAHCRGCSDFVARLSGHLHDVGSAIALPGALDALDGRISIPERALDFADRVRESMSGSVGRAQVAAEPVTNSAATGGTRGAAGAGAGLAAKLAGLGSAGKVASACLAGGAAATVCVAAGVAPVPFAGGEEERSDDPPRVATAEPRPARPSRPEPIDGLLPVQVGHEAPPEPQPDPNPQPVADPESAPAPEPEPVEPEPAPVVTEQPAVPAQVQEFSPVAPTIPAPSSSSSSSGSSSGGGSSQAAATNQEFGP